MLRIVALANIVFYTETAIAVRSCRGSKVNVTKLVQSRNQRRFSSSWMHGPETSGYSPGFPCSQLPGRSQSEAFRMEPSAEDCLGPKRRTESEPKGLVQPAEVYRYLICSFHSHTSESAEMSPRASPQAAPESNRPAVALSAT